MADIKKFLDIAGIKHLWSKISMQDYPNNETLMAVINAIDETKADKTALELLDIQSDWNQTDETQKDFILNKPDVATKDYVDSSIAETAIIYNSVLEMKEDSSLAVGATIITLGYYSANDGGGATYRIIESENKDKWCEETVNGYAELISDQTVNAECFGLKASDDFDCTTILQKVCTNYKYKIRFGMGTYRFSECFIGKGAFVDLYGISSEDLDDASAFVRQTIFAPFSEGQNYIMKFGGKADFSVDDVSDYTINQLSGISIVGITFTEDKLIAVSDLPYTALLTIDNCVNGHLALSFFMTHHTSLVIRESWEFKCDYISVRGSYTDVNTSAIILANRALTSSASNISNFTINNLDGEQIAGQLITVEDSANVSNSYIDTIMIENGRTTSNFETNGGKYVEALATSDSSLFDGTYTMNPFISLSNFSIGTIDLSLFGYGYFMNGDTKMVDGLNIAECVCGTVRTDLSVLYCNGNNFVLQGNSQGKNSSVGYLNSIAVIGDAYNVNGDNVIVNPNNKKLCADNILNYFKNYRAFTKADKENDSLVYNYYNGSASTILNRGGFTCPLYNTTNEPLTIELTLLCMQDISGHPFSVLFDGATADAETSINAEQINAVTNSIIKSSVTIPAYTNYDYFKIHLNYKMKVLDARAYNANTTNSEINLLDYKNLVTETTLNDQIYQIWTTAINTALSDASAGNGILFIPKGTYYIDSAISVPNNVVIEGANAEETIIAILPNSNINGFEYSIENVTGGIQRLTVQGDYLSESKTLQSTSGHGFIFKFATLSQFFFRDVIVKNFAYSGLRLESNVENFIFENSIFAYNRRYGILNSGQHNTFNNLKVFDNGWVGILNLESNYNTFSNIEVYNNNINRSDIVADSSTITASYEGGINFQNCHYEQLSQLKIYNNQTSGLYLNNCSCIEGDGLIFNYNGTPVDETTAQYSDVALFGQSQSISLSVIFNNSGELIAQNIFAGANAKDILIEYIQDLTATSKPAVFQTLANKNNNIIIQQKIERTEFIKPITLWSYLCEDVSVTWFDQSRDANGELINSTDTTQTFKNWSPAIAQALNDLKDIGGTLYFPQGTYYINEAINLTYKVGLMGAGPHVSNIRVIPKSTCNAIEINDYNGGAKIEALSLIGHYNPNGRYEADPLVPTRNRFVQLREWTNDAGEIINAESGDTWGNGIVFGSSTGNAIIVDGMEINNVIIQGFSANGILIWPGTWVLTIHHCSCFGNRRYGIDNRGTDNLFSNIDLYANGYGGLKESGTAGLNKYSNFKIQINSVDYHGAPDELSYYSLAGMALSSGSSIFTNIDCQLNSYYGLTINEGYGYIFNGCTFDQDGLRISDLDDTYPKSDIVLNSSKHILSEFTFGDSNNFENLIYVSESENIESKYGYTYHYLKDPYTESNGDISYPYANSGNDFIIKNSNNVEIKKFGSQLLNTYNIIRKEGTSVSAESTEGMGIVATSTFDFIQSGEGDPSPSNIRSINGYSSAYLTLNDEEIILDIGQTIYSGKLDWNTGVLTVDTYFQELNGTENWSATVSSVGAGLIHRLFPTDATKALTGDTAVNVYSDRYKGVAKNKRAAYSIYSFMNGTTTCVDIIDSDYTTNDDWKAYLSAQATAGTPVQVCWKLATPYTIQLTPQQLTTVTGTNTVSSSNSSLVVDFNRDANVIALINILYPIGSIYISANEVQPSVLFGGVWEQATDILVSSDSYYAWRRTA